MGGISFALYLLLTISGVALMFYYRPTVGLAYRDMKDLEFAITLASFLRKLHRWAAQAMVVAVILHMVRVFLNRRVQEAPRIQLGRGRAAAHSYIVPLFPPVTCSLGIN